MKFEIGKFYENESLNKVMYVCGKIHTVNEGHVLMSEVYIKNPNGNPDMSKKRNRFQSVSKRKDATEGWEEISKDEFLGNG